MFGNANENGLQPNPFPVALDPLLLVDYSIMENTGELHTIGAGRVRVQDDVALGRVLLGNGFPTHLSNRTRTGGTRNGDAVQVPSDKQKNGRYMGGTIYTYIYI